MDRKRFSNEIVGKRLLLIILTNAFLSLALFASVASADNETGEPDKQKIIRQVTNDWMEVAQKQYQRAYFKAAEKSLLQAQQYQQFLTDSERGKLKVFFQNVSKAITERERILLSARKAYELVKQDKLIEAKVHLEMVKGSDYLTQQEKRSAIRSLKNVDKQLSERKKQIAAIYKRSVKFFQAGQLEKARDGFSEVAKSGLPAAALGKTAEDYLMKIEGMLKSPAKPASPEAVYPWSLQAKTHPFVEDELFSRKIKPQMDPDKTKENDRSFIAVAEPINGAGTKPDPIERKRKLLRSYSRAVVKDSVEKAKKFVDEGRFYKAKIAVDGALATVNKNREHLGAEIFRQYQEQLRQLSDKIEKGRTSWLGSADEQNDSK